MNGYGFSDERDRDPDTEMCSCGHYEAESRVLWHEGRSYCGKCDPLILKPITARVKLPEPIEPEPDRYWEEGLAE